MRECSQNNHFCIIMEHISSRYCLITTLTVKFDALKCFRIVGSLLLFSAVPSCNSLFGVEAVVPQVDTSGHQWAPAAKSDNGTLHAAPILHDHCTLRQYWAHETHNAPRPTHQPVTDSHVNALPDNSPCLLLPIWLLNPSPKQNLKSFGLYIKLLSLFLYISQNLFNLFVAQNFPICFIAFYSLLLHLHLPKVSGF